MLEDARDEGRVGAAYGGEGGGGEPRWAGGLEVVEEVEVCCYADVGCAGGLLNVSGEDAWDIGGKGADTSAHPMRWMVSVGSSRDEIRAWLRVRSCSRAPVRCWPRSQLRECICERMYCGLEESDGLSALWRLWYAIVESMCCATLKPGLLYGSHVAVVTAGYHFLDWQRMQVYISSSHDGMMELKPRVELPALRLHMRQRVQRRSHHHPPIPRGSRLCYLMDAEAS